MTHCFKSAQEISQDTNDLGDVRKDFATIEHMQSSELERTSSFSTAISYATARPFLSGWRVGAIASFVAVIIALIANVAVTMWVKTSAVDGTLYRGSCAKTRRLNVWAHLAINAVSTLLLVASNFCMQILSAPNREELSQAHNRRTWLHVGVPNLRNLAYIGRDRALLWFLLFVSSIPLHLVFNSVIFAELQANEYRVVPTTADWMQGQPYHTKGFVIVMTANNVTISPGNNTLCPDESDGLYVPYSTLLTCVPRNSTLEPDEFDWLLNTTSMEIDRYRPEHGGGVVVFEDGTETPQWRNFSANECYSRFESQYVSNSGNVYIVQEKPTVWGNIVHEAGTSHWRAGRSIPIMSSPKTYPSNSWRCQTDDCVQNYTMKAPNNRTEWVPNASSVRYCMVEQVSENCSLLFNFKLALAVITANLIKAICMGIILISYWKHQAIVTVGDAIASFLDEPDPETIQRCLYGRQSIQALWCEGKSNHKNRQGIEDRQPQIAKLTASTWSKAISQNQWLTTYSL